MRKRFSDSIITGMKFRPCIDIHNGAVKQIIGGSLKDAGDRAEENFVSDKGASYYADLYKKDGYVGAHVIMLNPPSSGYYEKTKSEALSALNAFPEGLQIGGGITPENARFFLSQGAQKVIVTSYVFQNGQIHRDSLKKLKDAVGRDRLVLDLSCRKAGSQYLIVTDRWQTFTKEPVTLSLLNELSRSCSEFLIHAVDAEGKASGIEAELVSLLSEWDGCPITYAGGISSFQDLDRLYSLGKGRIHATIGSALDLFGGKLRYEDVKRYFRNLPDCP